MTDNNKQTKKPTPSGYVMEIHGRGSLHPAPEPWLGTGDQRPLNEVDRNRISGKMCPHVRYDHFNPETDTLTLRIDDEAHLEFWCEIDLKREDLLKALGMGPPENLGIPSKLSPRVTPIKMKHRKAKKPLRMNRSLRKST